MTTTPEQIAQLIATNTALTQYFQQFRDGLEQQVTEKKAEMDTHMASQLDQMTDMLPLSPNLLADTKYWQCVCGGATNQAVDVWDALDGHTWSWFWRDGEGVDHRTSDAVIDVFSGTLKVVTLDQLANEGCPFGGDLTLAFDEHSGHPNFHVLLLDITLHAPGSLYLLVQNAGAKKTFTDINRGEFTTQASALAYVMSHSGDITYDVHGCMAPTVRLKNTHLDQGWQYHHNSKKGFGGGYHPRFFTASAGHMKVAMALPYFGLGDHGGRFIYAQSVGRFTHDEYVPDGQPF